MINTNSFSTQPTQPIIPQNPNKVAVMPEREYPTPEQLNKLRDYATDQISESQAEKQATKESIWQAAIGKAYFESQQNVITAYTSSASDEAEYNSLELHSDFSVTETYMAIRDYQTSQLPTKAEVVDTVNELKDSGERMYIQSDVSAQAKTNQYLQIQHPVESSLMHMQA